MAGKVITDADFDSEVLQSETPSLVDFWAPWCGPCRALGPVIDEIAAEFEGKINVFKINVDENPSSSVTYGIRAIPTMILFKNGKVVEQVTGALPINKLKELISQKVLG